MATSETVVHITPQFFTERERTLIERGSLSASAFRFDSGVRGLRLRNQLGQLVLLPFQGQQVWSAEFGGRNLTMKSMFAQPWPTRKYLATYGVWTYLPAYGMVWLPDVVVGWQPFYYGHWIWTVDGWAWTSYEPYGWLVYHYGYWGFEPGIGWFWVPGETWYPTRVDWYIWGDYIAWAPLPPPGIVWVDPWVPYDIDIWIVIDADDFTSEDVGRYRVERTIYKDRVDRRTIVKSAPEVSEIERVTRKKVPVVEVREQQNYMRHREVPAPAVSSEPAVREPVLREPAKSRERTEAELKRIVLPKVERRKVERHADKVEREVLKRRKTDETSSRKSSGESPAERSSEKTPARKPSESEKSPDEKEDATRTRRK